MKIRKWKKWVVFSLLSSCLVLIGLARLRDSDWLADNPGEWYDSVREGEDEYENERDTGEIYRGRGAYILIDGERWLIMPPPDSDFDFEPDLDFRFVPDYEQTEEQMENIAGFTWLSIKEIEKLRTSG